MTAGAGVMVRRITCIDQRRRITVAAGTIRRTYRYQRSMVSRRLRMLGLPGACMTRRTVGRGRVADSGSDEGAGSCIMTARTTVMRIRCCAYQRIIMTSCTAGCTDRNARMAGIIRMCGFPGTRMARRTIGRGRVANG